MFVEYLWIFFVRSLLLLGIGVVNYSIWFSGDNVSKYRYLQEEIAQLNSDNRYQHSLNDKLSLEVSDMKKGGVSLERKARQVLNMIGEDETLYRIVD